MRSEFLIGLFVFRLTVLYYIPQLQRLDHWEVNNEERECALRMKQQAQLPPPVLLTEPIIFSAYNVLL
jgi:hypothetical protein